MRAVLTAACVLAVGMAVAADKPKKEKPAGGAVVGPLVGGLIGKDVGNPEPSPSADKQFVITKPVGTWVRDMTAFEADCRLTVGVTADRMTLTVEALDGKDTFTVRVVADYSINKESVLFGVIDSIELDSTDKNIGGARAQYAEFAGQPFAVRFRAEDDGLKFKDFKGLGVGLGHQSTELLAATLGGMNGRFTPVDPKKPLPPLKAKEKTGESRTSRLPSELPPLSLPPIAPPPVGLAWVAGEVFWNTWDSLFSQRTVRILPPVYFPPDPLPPLKEMRDSMLDPTGEIIRGNPAKVRTSGYAGPIPRADVPKAEVKREEVLHQEFDSWQPGETGPRVFDLTPKFTTPQRIHGGILKADPPKGEDLRAISKTYKK